MGKKIFSNLGLKILALFLGFVVWLVVLNVDDYSTTRQIQDIPVTLINTNAITDQNKLFDVVAGETVDIVVKGRRSVVENLTASDFTAVADMSKLSITNAVTVMVSANKSSIENTISINIVDDILQVELEEEKSVSLPVTVTTKGEPADGYAVGTAVATPNLINVNGAESVVNSVASVCVEVDVQNRREAISARCTPLFYNEDGKLIPTGKLQCDVEGIAVTVPIYRTKEVPVILKTKGRPAADCEVSKIEYVPEKVRIGAPTEILTSIQEIVIDDIDVSDADKSFEVSVDISKYLPDEAVVVDNTSISVRIGIEKTITKEISVTADDITIENKMQDCEYQIEFPYGFAIMVKGLSDNVSKLKASDFNLKIDAGLLGIGEHEVILDILDGDGYTIENQMTVLVRVMSMP